MVKKTAEPSPTLEWNPKCKEAWLVELEKQWVNDEKWSCAVTAAIQAEVQAEECIQIFTQCTATGLRKAIKTITMSDVISLLKESNQKSQSNKKENKNPQKEKSKRKASVEKPKSTHRLSTGSAKIIDLAAKYAKLTDFECKLPPDLMAALLKHMILTIKEENIIQKKTQIAERKKERKKKIEATFVQNLKPFEIREEEKGQNLKSPSNILGLRDPINDEPYGGPDLYIVLIDFYDPFYFPELIRVNVPFIALLKVSHFRETGKWSHTSVPEKTEAVNKKGTVVSQFWKTLKENCVVLDKTQKFKDIAMMQYQAPVFKPSEPKQHIYGVVFDEISWMLYSAYRVYRQHQNYLRELYVQSNVLSLEPLDLGKCGVYNKLCDALVTGEPNTPWLVLYAMIEQVVAGVPHTESMPLEYHPQVRDFFKIELKPEDVEDDGLSDVKKNGVRLVTPCLKCRGKEFDPMEICKHLKQPSVENTSSEKGEWSDETNKKQTSTTKSSESVCGETPGEDLREPSNLTISESLISKVLLEKAEAENLDSKKSPKIYFYGDSVSIQSYHCDPRLLNTNTIVNRFFKNSGVLRLWAKYPELPPEGRAFYKYHFQRLQNVSKENSDVLKLKVFFTISMKLIGMTKSYLYRGEEENVSEMFPPAGREKMKKLSKVRFEHNVNIAQIRGDGKNFSNYFFKTFLDDTFLRAPKRGIKMNPMRSSLIKTDSYNLRKVTSQINMYLVTHRSSGVCYPYCFKHSDGVNDPFSGPANDREFSMLTTLLDCFEISNIAEPHFLHDKDDYQSLIEGFKFFEKLESNRMIQVVLDAQNMYNTVQCSYFAPTDTLLIVMHNDFDYRGVFYSYGVGALHTPVGLRDFYNFVYPEINEWLVEEEAEHERRIKELREKVEEKEKENDNRFLVGLKEQFCKMNEEERMEYLKTGARTPVDVDISTIELPAKPQYSRVDRLSFVTTNFRDIRIEAQKNVHEYHSKDGTEVNVFIDSWLYDPLRLLTLGIKKGTLSLFYYQWLGSEEVCQNFTLKTSSDIIVAFYKPDTGSGYQVEVSWPVGLIVQKITPPSGAYIKQSYLEVYRKTWDIREEESRCFLTNGQVVIFKKKGTEVLSGSGAKCLITDVQKGSKKIPKYEITTSVGEVWEVTHTEHCHVKKLIGNLKIYIGVDTKTQEVFYKRDDGVCCMLRPSAKLVTNFPDGTKITSIPEFEEDEVTIEWTEEERTYFAAKYRKKPSQVLVNDTRSSACIQSESFVSVLCTYLIEHPKYSGVYITSTSVQLNMPEELTINMYKDGAYEVKKDNHVLSVQDIIEFYSDCPNCEGRSTATLTPNSDEICKFVDFTNKIFSVHKNGSTSFQDNNKNLDDVSECEVKNDYNIPATCDHIKTTTPSQRCFALERNLSGYEFIHSNTLANYCYDLPTDTYFELDSKSSDTTIISHMFSSPYTRIGFENWIMDYSNNDSLPTNLRRIDLKEQKGKESQRKFALWQNSDGDTSNRPTRCLTEVFEMPKMVVTRIVKCLSQAPTTVIDDLQKYVYGYQKEAHDLCDKYRSYKTGDDRAEDPRYVKMRLRKIALTLCQNLNPYPHLCSQVPSTEKDVHYFGHLVKVAEEYKEHMQDDGLVPDCKQIPKTLPKIGDFGSILEDNESPLDSYH